MATYNGIGTVRYDWQRRDDTTANATVWFVIFFLPIYPLRREHVRVHGSGIRKGTPMETIAAMFGFGQGFHSEIEVLGPTSNALWRIARTYLLGWIVVPLLCMMGPVLLFTVMINITQAIGYDMKSDGAWLPMITGILGLLWIGCLVAYILDRSAGRHHIYDETKELPPTNEASSDR